MSAEVENSTPVPPDPSAASTAPTSNSPPTSPTSSKVPFKKEKKKGERKERHEYDHANIFCSDLVEIILPIVFQSQRRQMTTCWAGFKGTA